jgi:hypothetical protein
MLVRVVDQLEQQLALTREPNAVAAQRRLQWRIGVQSLIVQAGLIVP